MRLVLAGKCRKASGGRPPCLCRLPEQRAHPRGVAHKRGEAQQRERVPELACVGGLHHVEVELLGGAQQTQRLKQQTQSQSQTQSQRLQQVQRHRSCWARPLAAQAGSTARRAAACCDARTCMWDALLAASLRSLTIRPPSLRPASQARRREAQRCMMPSAVVPLVLPRASALLLLLLLASVAAVHTPLLLT